MGGSIIPLGMFGALPSPNIINKFPQPDNYGGSETLISFDVVDADGNLKQEDLRVYVNDILAFEGYVDSYSFYNPFNVVGSQFYATIVSDLDGYHLDIKSDDPYIGTSVSLYAHAEDSYGATLDDYWSFYLSEAPFILNRDPDAYDTGVLPNTLISLDILNAGGGLKQDGIIIYVNDLIAFEGYGDGYFVSSHYSGLGTQFYLTSISGSDGYHIDLDNIFNFDPYELVTVRVIAENIYGDSIDSSYYFRIEDSEDVVFSSYYPASGAQNVAKDTYVMVDAYDVGSGIDIYSIDAYVNGVKVFDGVTQTFYYPFEDGYLTPITIDGYDGYRFVLKRNTGTYYESNESVSIRIIMNDKEGV